MATRGPSPTSLNPHRCSTFCCDSLVTAAGVVLYGGVPLPRDIVPKAVSLLRRTSSRGKVHILPSWQEETPTVDTVPVVAAPDTACPLHAERASSSLTPSPSVTPAPTLTTQTAGACPEVADPTLATKCQQPEPGTVQCRPRLRLPRRSLPPSPCGIRHKHFCAHCKCCYCCGSHCQRGCLRPVAMSTKARVRRVPEFVMSVTLGLLGLAVNLLHPFRREIPKVVGSFVDPSTGKAVKFEANDPALSYPLVKEYIPMPLLLVLVMLLPSLLLVVVRRFVMHAAPKRTFRNIALGAISAHAINNWVTHTLKIMAGRPRPNYYALVAVGREKFGLKSFPSGHSSTACASLVFLSLVLLDLLQYLPGYRHSRARSMLLRFTCVALPACAALAICASRTMDYHHNFADVLAGAFIGSLSAVCGYHMQRLGSVMTWGLSRRSSAGPAVREPASALAHMMNHHDAYGGHTVSDDSSSDEDGGDGGEWGVRASNRRTSRDGLEDSTRGGATSPVKGLGSPAPASPQQQEQQQLDQIASDLARIDRSQSRMRMLGGGIRSYGI